LIGRGWQARDIENYIKLIEDPNCRYEDNTGMFFMSDDQAKAILELQLHKLTGLERDKIHNDLKDLGGEIKRLLEILGSSQKITEIIRGESQAIIDNFGHDRLTQISESELDMDMEDLIAQEDMVITITNTGYIKRVALDTYRAQKRGGKGRNAMTTKDEDFVTDVFVANTHTPLMFFSSTGMCYRLKTYKIPEGGAAAKGRPLVNLLPLSNGETITTILPVPEGDHKFLMFATKNGNVRRNDIADFESIRANGKIAMKLDEGDSLIAVRLVSENDDLLLSTYRGKVIRFAVDEVRVFAGRASDGVRAIKLAGDDRVIDMAILGHIAEDSETRAAYIKQSRAERRAATGIDEEASDDEETSSVELSAEKYSEMKMREQFILAISENGFGKRTSSYEYRTTHRGGNGFTGIKLGGKNTAVAATFPIASEMDLMIVTDGGKIIRTRADEIRIAGRSTAGVTLFRTADKEKVISATAIEHEDEIESTEPTEEGQE
jgi:DNA gyrase subunit A